MPLRLIRSRYVATIADGSSPARNCARTQTGSRAGGVNVTTGGASAGVQWALVAINKGSFSGWQAAGGAVTQGQFKGLQSGWFTSAKRGEGVQWGLVNTAEYWNGLQFGLVNYTQRLHGVQIGLINIIKTGGQFPVFPIVHWSF